MTNQPAAHAPGWLQLMLKSSYHCRHLCQCLWKLL